MDGRITSKMSGDGTWQVDVFSAVDENSVFPELPKTTINTISIDLGEMTYINSSGMRKWVFWLQLLATGAPDAKLEMKRIPLHFIQSSAVFDKILPQKTNVPSFFIDCFCTPCGTEERRLLDNKPELSIPKLQCAKCQKDMDYELDVGAYEALSFHAPRS